MLVGKPGHSCIGCVSMRACTQDIQDLNCARRAAVHQPQTTDAFYLSAPLNMNISTMRSKERAHIGPFTSTLLDIITQKWGSLTWKHTYRREQEGCCGSDEFLNWMSGCVSVLTAQSRAFGEGCVAEFFLPVSSFQLPASSFPISRTWISLPCATQAWFRVQGQGLELAKTQSRNRKMEKQQINCFIVCNILGTWQVIHYGIRWRNHGFTVDWCQMMAHSCDTSYG